MPVKNKDILPEILAPAGSFESLRAAIAGGANAVYLAGKNFGARAFAKNFDNDELRQAISYARSFGVKVYAAVNTLIGDREFEEAIEFCKFLCECRVSAVIVQDLGLASVLRKIAPKLALHGSTQMAIHNLDGVRKAEELGIKRVVLARELSMKEIKNIADNTELELEVFVHGSLCVSQSGQCLMSAAIGRRSANRGKCAGPCRLPYAFEGERPHYILSMKDLCLADKLEQLRKIGVNSFKIEGRMKRPEFVFAVTKLYKTAIMTGRTPKQSEIDRLARIFSRSGFTDGYFERQLGRDMFGMRVAEDAEDYKNILKDENRKQSEVQTALAQSPVNFTFTVKKGERVKLSAVSGEFSVCLTSEPAEPAVNKEITREEARAQLAKTGGTRFIAGEITCEIDEGLSLPKSVINMLRRDALEALAAEIDEGGHIECADSLPPPEDLGIVPEKTRLYASFNRIGQIPQNIGKTDIVFLPAGEIAARKDVTTKLLEKTSLGIAFPKVIHGGEKKEYEELVKEAALSGAKYAMIENIGQFAIAKKFGLEIICGIAANVFNSYAESEYKNFGASEICLSPELSSPQIRDMKKNLPLGIFAYGKLPLMVTENCIVGSASDCGGRCKAPAAITDKTGQKFEIIQELGCRNIILNGKTLYLADKAEEISKLGLGFLLLSFTTEDESDAEKVIEAYSGGADAKPEEFTRGLFARGVL